jgi:hypothetical protein
MLISTARHSCKIFGVAYILQHSCDDGDEENTLRLAKPWISRVDGFLGQIFHPWAGSAEASVMSRRCHESMTRLSSESRTPTAISLSIVFLSVIPAVGVLEHT